jgi:hypothetical protein
MSSTKLDHHLKPHDAALTVAQLALKALCEEILTLKPAKNQLTFWGFGSNADPLVAQQRLRESSLQDLLLKDGATLSARPASDHYQELGLFVGKANLAGVAVRAWLWEYPKRRVDPSSPKTGPYEVINYQGELDWQHQLDISLEYTAGEQTAWQVLSAHTGSLEVGELPDMSRDVVATAYREMGYEGHNQKWREAKSEGEVLAFVELARELFVARQAR